MDIHCFKKTYLGILSFTSRKLAIFPLNYLRSDVIQEQINHSPFTSNAHVRVSESSLILPQNNSRIMTSEAE